MDIDTPPHTDEYTLSLPTPIVHTGSRLPLPQGWLAGVPPSSETAPPLTLSLPMALGLAMLSSRNWPQAPPSQPPLAAAVQAAVPAVFLSLGAMVQASQPAGQQPDPAWRQPAVRRATAGLLAALAADVKAARALTWTMPQAQALAAAYAAESYGDGLFGAAVGLLLQAHVTPAVQVCVVVRRGAVRSWTSAWGHGDSSGIDVSR